MSRRAVAIAELRTRLEGITTANGYTTDAGEQLFIGEQPVLGPDDPDAALALVVREDEPGYQGENVDIALPIEVQVITKAAPQAWDTIEAVIGDVKKAVEQDHDLGGALKPRGLVRGATKPIDREGGSEFVAVAVEYRLLYQERWGAP